MIYYNHIKWLTNIGGDYLTAIKTLREKNKLTQISLATALGVKQSTVAMWENGENKPRADKLKKLAEILNCTVDELLREGE